ncbi:hypothetical protein [Lutibacter sp. B1]|uniref:hypothetical protein n=1 Tax=Lutibacter sp. B1 TaxID=2725996 RepID=UPI001456E621|nr:hypothetical protein [Lutibacter sp. B1]NLP57491.1 hypothetical protein [Lutibacter sp. B1]
MKNIVIILAILFSFYACKKEIKKTADTQQTEVSEKIDIPTLALNEFDSKAGDFVNKQVLVKGIVDHVCKHGGKKILLVTDDGDVHVTSDERFDEALMGSEIVIKGVVLEERIDEAYCLKMEDDNIKSHSEGKSNEDQFKAKKEHIQQYRDQMKAENTDHISIYSLKYVSHTVVE